MKKQRDVRIGTVIRTVDKSRSGTLWIKPDNEDEGRPDVNDIQATMASPCIGGGYGFIHIPGPGSRVLYSELKSAGEGDSPDTYVWFAAVSFSLIQSDNMNVLGNSVDDPSDYNAASIDLDPFPKVTDDGGVHIDGGIPNSNLIYGDNDTPQAAVWRAPPGHFLQFSNKVTKWGTHDVATLLMNASGKFLKIDDGPPTEGMDRITISDEMTEYGGNRIEILTGDPEKPNSIYVQSKQDQDYVSIEGSQVMAITNGEGAQIRENMATGGIHDFAYTADHSITAETDIRRTSETGDITETAKEGDITINAAKGVITLNSRQNVVLNSGDQQVTIDAPMGIILQCGTSKIEILPTAITISADILNTCGRLAGDSIRGPVGTSLMLHEHVSPFFGLPTLGHPTPPSILPCV